MHYYINYILFYIFIFLFQKQDNGTRIEIDQLDRNVSVGCMENRPVTYTWKDLTIKTKGKEARKGIFGIGKRDATGEKHILKDGNFLY